MFLAEEVHEERKLRDAALKLFFLPDRLGAASAEAAAWRDGVLGEARALCRIEHPNVVRFYSVQRDDARGVLALAMEHVAGESLEARLLADGPSVKARCWRSASPWPGRSRRCTRRSSCTAT